MPNIITGHNDVLIVLGATNGGWCIYAGRADKTASEILEDAPAAGLSDDEGLLEWFAEQLALAAPQVESEKSGGVPAIAVPRGPFDRLIRAITPVRDVYLRRLADHHDEAADWSDHVSWPVTIGMLREVIFARDDLIESDYDLLRPVPPKPRADEAPAAAIVPPPVSADLVSHMVNRFLAWRLPETFSPDAGITFTRVMNEGTPYAFKSEPTGTNLFDAQQAEAMVRHMLEGAPAADGPDVGELAAQATTAMLTLADVRKELEPFLQYAIDLRDQPDNGYLAIESGPDGHYRSLRYHQLRALLRAAGLFTDDMRPSQSTAADASVKPAEAAPLPPPADAHHSDDDESAETGQDADAVAPVRARDGLGDASHAGAPRADEAAGEQSLAADRRDEDPF